jgi:hypothetical protein
MSIITGQNNRASPPSRLDTLDLYGKMEATVKLAFEKQP